MTCRRKTDIPVLTFKLLLDILKWIQLDLFMFFYWKWFEKQFDHRCLNYPTHLNKTSLIVNWTAVIVSLYIDTYFLVWYTNGTKHCGMHLCGIQLLKNLKRYDLLNGTYHFKFFIKAVFHKFYLVHSWILCYKFSWANHSPNSWVILKIWLQNN